MNNEGLFGYVLLVSKLSLEILYGYLSYNLYIDKCFKVYLQLDEIKP